MISKLASNVIRQNLLLFMAIAGSLRGAGAPDRTAPRFSGDTIPEPPEQKSSWTPPASELRPEFISATRSLFEQGLADPRGCEYRELEVGVGEPWSGDGGMVKTHGWVLPENAGSRSRFAICWNGLIYPAVSVGENVDLKLDLRTFTNNVMAGGRDGFNSVRMEWAVRESRAVAVDYSSPVKACLMLRVGEVEMAATLWKPWEAAWQARNDPEVPNDPYLFLARQWAWTLFDRTICAHMRGDDKLALLSARKLAQMNTGVEADAAKRGFVRRNSFEPAEQGRLLPYLEFLEPLADLLADQERRALRGAHPSAIESGLENHPDQNKRIAALIDSLDEVAARQMSQPGMVAPEYDPIVAALIKEGEAAVEPLITCMEEDKRLTRSVGFHRDFKRHRVIISVRSAARTALENILHKEFSTHTSEIRAFWNQFKGTSLEERWYRMLQGDNGHALEAAQSIVQPENEIGVPGSFHSIQLPLKRGQKPSFRGEVLRTRKNPSVTELLVKQAQTAMREAVRQNQAMGVDAVGTAYEFTSILSQWEKAAAVAPARACMRRAKELWREELSFTMSSGHDLARYIAQLTSMRVKGRDADALAEYTAWLKSAEPRKIDRYVMEVFEPLWMNPDDAAVLTASEWLFNDRASPWSALITTNRTGAAYEAPNLITTPLIALPGFQQHLFRMLADTNHAGVVKTLDGGNWM